MSSRSSSRIRAKSLSESEKISYIVDLEAYNRLLRKDIHKYSVLFRATAAVLFLVFYYLAFWRRQVVPARKAVANSLVNSTLVDHYYQIADPYANSVTFPPPFENFTLAHFGWILKHPWATLNLQEKYVPGKDWDMGVEHDPYTYNLTAEYVDLVLKKPWENEEACGATLENTVCAIAIDVFNRAKKCVLEDKTCKFDWRTTRLFNVTNRKEMIKRSNDVLLEKYEKDDDVEKKMSSEENGDP